MLLREKADLFAFERLEASILSRPSVYVAADLFGITEQMACHLQTFQDSGNQYTLN